MAPPDERALPRQSGYAQMMADAILDKVAAALLADGCDELIDWSLEDEETRQSARQSARVALLAGLEGLKRAAHNLYFERTPAEQRLVPDYWDVEAEMAIAVHWLGQALRGELN